MDLLTQVPTAADLQSVVDCVVAESHVPGAGIAVSMGGHQVAAYSGIAALGRNGGLSDDSRFETSCLMKLFLSLAALELSREGVLDLEAPVSEYLQDFGAALSSETTHKVRRISISDLLMHTSGYRGLDVSRGQIRWNYSWKAFLEHLSQSGQLFSPGSVFNYEHSEHVVLGEIVARTCGEPARAIVRDMLFRPLGIKPSRANVDNERQGVYVGQHTYAPNLGRFVPVSLPAFGTFWDSSLPDETITLREMLSVGEAIIDGTRANESKSIFGQETVRALQRPGISLPPQVTSGPRCERIPVSFGMGVSHYEGGVLGHNGSTSGQTCGLRIDLERGIAIAVGVNAWAPYARDSAIGRTFALVSGNERASREVTHNLKEWKVSRQHLLNGFSTGDVIGRYLGSYWGEVQLTCREDSIHCELGRGGAKRPGISIVPDGAEDYRIESDMPVMCCIFKDPDTGGPALMMGVHAYKKEQ